MARAKYFNEQNQKWEYMDIANSTIPVDAFMSNNSTNPVQNKVITEALSQKQDLDKEWEIVENIIIGYKQLTEKPADWETNYNNYYYFMPSVFRMDKVSRASQWAPELIYAEDPDFIPLDKITRKNYNFKKTKIFFKGIQTASYSIHVNFRTGDYGIDTSTYPAIMPEVVAQTTSEIEIENGYPKVQISSINGNGDAPVNVFPQKDKFQPINAITGVDIYKYPSTTQKLVKGEMIQIMAVK